MRKHFAILVALLLPAAVTVAAQQPTEQHHNQQQDKRHQGVNERGDHAMGFSHEKTTHHFRLSPSGGVIEVVANDSSDTTSQEQIRSHLTHIAKLFKEGDFSMPMFTHGETPPGVPALIRLREDIAYTFETIERGGRVRIAATNADAIEAIHQFLRYQIKDHQTGDSMDVDKQETAITNHACHHREGCPFAAANRGATK